jgi:DUF1680 family protein
MKQTLPLSAIKIDDAYWNRYTKLIPEKVIPYQWEILNDRIPDAPPSYCLENFRIAAGEKEGKQRGMVFQDSDAAKWLEAVAYSLASKPDPELEKNADELIALIGRAQEKDGYLNTYFSLNYPHEKWKNLTEGHELYCAGHFIEAAVAYYETTGKKQFLEIVCRFADLICKTFGTKEDQCHGYPGHPEIELALVKLYRITGESRYLETAKYFIDERGGSPNYFIEEMKHPDFRHIWPALSGCDPKYFQSHLPVRQQDTAEGHSVRALYLYCAMADIAEECNDSELLERCKILWNNVVQKRMYVTGSVGSSGHLERFTVDYDLPNDANYSETCASIALAMFAMRMAKVTGDASYFDTAELALYNTVRSGISLEGDRYFYVNPMEVWPETCMDYTSRSHIKAVRQKWFDCACCPTNVARIFTSLGDYIYFKDKDELFVNLFIQNETSFELNGKQVVLSLTTDYPKTGIVKIAVKSAEVPFSLNVRIPAFAEDFAININNTPAKGEKQNNYFHITNIQAGDEITFSFSMKPRIIYPNPKVHQNCGKAAIARGPEIFCLEECDNAKNLAALLLDTQAPLTEHWQEDLLGGVMQIKAKGRRLIEPPENESFSQKFIPKTEDVTLTALPYGYWGNRSLGGEMLVWIRQYGH